MGTVTTLSQSLRFSGDGHHPHEAIQVAEVWPELHRPGALCSTVPTGGVRTTREQGSGSMDPGIWDGAMSGEVGSQERGYQGYKVLPNVRSLRTHCRVFSPQRRSWRFSNCLAGEPGHAGRTGEPPFGDTWESWSLGKPRTLFPPRPQPGSSLQRDCHSLVKGLGDFLHTGGYAGVWGLARLQ